MQDHNVTFRKRKLALPRWRLYLLLAQQRDQNPRRFEMAWKAPKIVEVSVGMEINMYACAARK